MEDIDVTMPAEVRDASAGTVTIEVDTARARLLPVPDDFELVETRAGRTAVTLAVIDYRDNDLGDYNEIGVTVFVLPRGVSDAEAGTFITHLPVDQEFTCAAGQEIWGFPKTVEDITINYQADHVIATLRGGGQLALRLRLPRGGSEVLDDMPMTTYTVRDGRPCSTPFTQGGGGSQVLVGDEGVEIELGDHPLGRLLAQVGLVGPSATVQMTTWTEKMRGSFGAPTALAG